MIELPLSKVYQLIEPGPVVLVTTTHGSRANVMTMTFHMVVDHEMPLIGAVLGPWNHSFAALLASRECVIAIPTVDLATQVVDIGNCSGSKVEKLEKFGLTSVPAGIVGAPLVRECLANLECRVVDLGLVAKYSMFILQVVKAWIARDRLGRRTIHHNGDGTFVVDGETIDLKARMVKWPEMLD